jgi:competence protein ComEC
VGGDAGAFLQAVTLGDRSGITPTLSEAFRHAGTSHLLTIGGLHLGILAVCLLALLRPLLGSIPALALRFPVDPLARLLTLPVLLGYAALAGFDAPTVRALTMATLAVAAGLTARRVRPVALVGSTALVMALFEPLLLLDPGFQFTMVSLLAIFATAGGGQPVEEATLPLEVPRWRQWIDRAAHALAAGLRVSIAATLATLPVAAFHFGKGSLAGLLVNPVAVPLGGAAALVPSLAGVGLHALWPQGARALWWAAAWPVRGMLWVQELAQALPSDLSASALRTGVGVAGAYAVLGGGWLLWRRRGWLGAGVALAGVALLVVPGQVRAWRDAQDPRAQLWLLDVGAAQAAAVRMPGGRWVLVDGGGSARASFDVGRSVVTPALDALGARRIDLIVSSHPHADHVGGLPSVIAEKAVGEIWLPESYRGDPRYDALLAAALARGTPVRWIGAGPVRRAVGGGEVEVVGANGVEENDWGLVARMTCGGEALLVPSDVGIAAQRDLLARGWVTPARLYVASHHGSADASDPDFLAAVAPRTVLVSTDGGRGLPSEALREAAARRGAALRRTDLEGCLHERFGPGAAVR